MGKASESDAKVTNQMRLSNPLLLLSLGIVLAAASCTLITDVDRSKIPDGQAGEPGTGGDGSPSGGTTPQPQGGDAGMGGSPGGNGGTNPGPSGGGGAGGNPEGGAGGTAEGGAGAGMGGSAAGMGGVPAASAGAAGSP